MLATIVVVVISLVLIAIALVVFFRWRSSTSHVRMRNKMGVRSISSVGISAQAPILRRALPHRVRPMPSAIVSLRSGSSLRLPSVRLP